MKNFIYLYSLLLFMGSCVSIDKLVEKGEYDRAIALAAKKLQGKKHKKTKYVKGLERAFKKITTKDLKHVNNLIERDDPRYWDEIYETYRVIEKRQRVIQPLLPLRSKDGYKATFRFVKTAVLKKKAADNAALYYYEKGKSLMKKANNGDKIAARKAYKALERIDKYRSNFKNTGQLMDSAYKIGQTKVLVEMRNRSSSILPMRFEKELFGFGVRNLDTRWYKFYTDKRAINRIDVTAIYYIDFIDASPEKELVDHFIASREVADGWDYALDRHGNVMKDTSGNDIKTQRFKTVTADVANVIMEKSIGMDGHLVVTDVNTRRVLVDKPLSGEAVFDEHFSTFRGDERALSNKTRNRLNQRPMYFPSDEELLLITANELKDELRRNLRQLLR